MIEISISRQLADGHPAFMAHCADRGHPISVFDGDGARTRPRADGPQCVRPLPRSRG